MFENQPNYLKGVLWWKYCNQTCPFVCNIKLNLFAAEDRPCKIGISLEMIFSSQALEVLSLLHWHASAWLTAAQVRCVVALTSQCSKLKAIKGVPFAPCKDPSKVPKFPILRSFQPIIILPLLKSSKSSDWFSAQFFAKCSSRRSPFMYLSADSSSRHGPIVKSAWACSFNWWHISGFF